MARSLYKFLAFLVVTTLVAACAPQADVKPTRTPISAGSLQPYQSPTPSATPLPATPIPSQTPPPTATPHIYTVKSGDTIGSVALNFGLDMGDLVNANPDVSPYAMSVGQALLIPNADATPATLPTIEPQALSFYPPNCYATLSAGMWCFVLVQNDSDVALEGISLDVRLFDPAGNLLSNETAFLLQDRLLAGDAQPALVYFEGMPANSHAQANVLTAFEGKPDDARYPDVRLLAVFTQIAWDAKTAQVNGELLVDGEDAVDVWVVATVYDSKNDVVGVRRWESIEGEKAFRLMVASLGPEIERISLSVEAHR